MNKTLVTNKNRIIISGIGTKCCIMHKAECKCHRLGIPIVSHVRCSELKLIPTKIIGVIKSEPVAINRRCKAKGGFIAYDSNIVAVKYRLSDFKTIDNDFIIQWYFMFVTFSEIV